MFWSSIYLQWWRPGFNPWVGKIPGKGRGYPLQCSGLENFMDCIVHGVTESQTRLSDFHLFLQVFFLFSLPLLLQFHQHEVIWCHTTEHWYSDSFILSSLCVSPWTVSIAVSSGSVIFSSVLPNLLWIPPMYFSLKILYFSSLPFCFESCWYHPCLSLSCSVFPYISWTWSILISTVLTSLSTNLIIFFHFGVCFIDWFFSLLWTVDLCFFVCLISFDWLLDIMNFLLFAMGFQFL